MSTSTLHNVRHQTHESCVEIESILFDVKRIRLITSTLVASTDRLVFCSPNKPVVRNEVTIKRQFASIYDCAYETRTTRVHDTDHTPES